MEITHCVKDRVRVKLTLRSVIKHRFSSFQHLMEAVICEDYVFIHECLQYIFIIFCLRDFCRVHILPMPGL